MHACFVNTVIALSSGPPLSLFSSTECSRHQACLVTTLQIQPGGVRCVFYPEIQNCIHNLESQSCWVLLREEAAYIYRKSGESPDRGGGERRPGLTCVNSMVGQAGAGWGGRALNSASPSEACLYPKTVNPSVIRLKKTCSTKGRRPCPKSELN